jgi:multidrug resistance efflux pump
MNATNVVVPLTVSGRAPVVTGSITEALAGSLASRWRRGFFRGLRIVSAGGLLSVAAFVSQQNLRKVESDQAFINAAVSPLRAPIGGQLQMDRLEPGAAVAAGTALFRVENPRFGNLETMSQLNWVQELVDRLRAELGDLEVRLSRQQAIFKHYEALFAEKLISRLAYLEEESKVALCQTAVTQKKDQLRSAEARGREIEHHLSVQKQASVSMPFTGVIWAVRGQDQAEVAAQETVLHVIDPRRLWVDAFVNEKHADKFGVGTEVTVRARDGTESWRGRVESVRAGVGRIDPESVVAVPPCDLSRRRVSVRVKLDAAMPFTAAQFFGVGRSVIVSLPGRSGDL